MSNQRGTALVAVLSLAMILVPLGALVVMQARTDLSIQHNLHSDMEVFYLAEAGLEHAVADILPGQSFSRLLAGPDRLSGTTDDGVFPFASPPPAYFPSAPLRYDVQVVAGSNGTVRIVSRATGHNGSAKVLEAVVTRAPTPFTPAALYTETGATGLDLGSAGFRLSGVDHQVAFPPVPAAAPMPSLPDVGTTARLDLASYATSIASAPAAHTFAATDGDIAQAGTRATPQVSIVDGDLSVSGALAGCGILVVRGALHVTGALEFSGLVLALGPILFEPSSAVTVVGSLWQAPSQDERLELRGAGAVVYSNEALTEVDRAFPGLLPHAAVVAGWQEQL